MWVWFFFFSEPATTEIYTLSLHDALPIYRIFRVVSDVLGVPIEKVNDESSPDTTQAWDSLSHINLILALEAEFAISLSQIGRAHV